MIQKIENIRSIGIYDDYTASGDVTLKKFNMIYAENGAGKTTLASILRSLASNETALIGKRKRIDTHNEPLVCIKKDDGTQYKFSEGKWNHDESNIEVFDSFFVNDNIYSGMEITSDNRKHLYKFIIGNTGVAINCKIERVKQFIDKKNDEKNILVSELSAYSKGMPIDNFMELPKDNTIDYQIEQKDEELKAASNNEILLSHSKMPDPPAFIFNIDLDKVIIALEKSINTISKGYINQVTTHVQHLEANGLTNAQAWLSQGNIVAKKNNVCPFCGQLLDKARKVIEGYNQYFNDEYTQLKEDINNILEDINKYNVALEISSIQNFHEKLTVEFNFWKSYIKNLSAVPILIDNISCFERHFSDVEKLIESKKNDPLNNNNNNTNTVQELKKDIDEITKYMTDVNLYKSYFTNTVEVFKQNLRPKETIEQELKYLSLQKIRHTQYVDSHCILYSITKNQISRLQDIITKLRQQQKNATDAYFQSYGNKTNYYLNDVFGTKFKITNIHDAGYKGKAKDPTIDFALTFNNKMLFLDTDDNLSVKYTLSEGDKNTIAFSFFLAKLDHYNNTELANKIIVFDDPLTSLDMNRRNTTVNQLVKYKDLCQQEIVLSHNLYFLLELNNRKKIGKNEKKVLQIVNENGTSKIIEYALREKLYTEYVKNIRAMNAFLTNPIEENKEGAINAIRLSLEVFLKFKYGMYLSDFDETFGKIIHILDTDNNCHFIDSNKVQVIKDLNELCDISWRIHHASPEESAERSEVDITLNELYNIYVPKTLELLNSRL